MLPVEAQRAIPTYPGGFPHAAPMLLTGLALIWWVVCT